MAGFTISLMLLVALAQGISSQDTLNESQHDVHTSTEHDDHAYAKIEDILKLDEDEDSGFVENRIGSDDVEPEEEESDSSLIWIILGVVFVVFVSLGVFNHIIIPRFCISNKDEKEEEKGIQMSELKDKEIEKRESVGNHNDAFEDVPLKTIEKESDRIEIIENEKAILEVASALEANTEPKTKLVSNSDEYTNTPRNSMSKEKEDGVNLNNDLTNGKMLNSQDDVIEKANVKEGDKSEPVAKEEVIENSIDKSPKVTQGAGSVKEAFRSRKKSTMSIEIEDGNIKNFVEGGPGERIPVIAETSQE